MKLLIAEDDLTSRTMLMAICRKWGYEPIAVEDGEEAWLALQEEESPRLLLIDWEMPKLSGLELCQRIRQQETTNPPFIILLTARNETTDIVAGLEAGANDYIVKPFANAELQARLQVGQRMLSLQAELNQAREKLAFQATHDFLTGLLNRRAVMKALEREIVRAQRQQHILCVGLCDIDHFKKVNDIYGHLAGDQVLQEAAQRFQTTLRPYDVIGRYGGEEFLILLSIADDNAKKHFDRIRHSISDQPFIYGKTPLNINISCGVTMITSAADKRNCTEILLAADTALYEAKAAGRNCTIIADKEQGDLS